MSLTLYGAILSPFVRKVRIALALKEIEHELVNVNPHEKPDWYLEINPLGRIPALKIAEDKYLADSAAICGYLEKEYPQAPLYPVSSYEYGQAVWFEKYADYELFALCSGVVFVNRILNPLMGGVCDEEAIEKALKKRLPKHLAYLEQSLQGKEWFVGGAMTIADVAVAGQIINMRYAGEDIDAALYPQLAALVERVATLPVVEPMLAQEAKVVEKLTGK